MPPKRAAFTAIALALILLSCSASQIDALAAVKACAPPGWSAGVFPPGSHDYGLGPGADLGRIRLLVPDSVVSGKGLSKPGAAVYITDWWTVASHDEAPLTFADGRSGKRYTSTAGDPQVTAEFATAAGTWQLYSKADEHHDDVLRCLEAKLAQTTGP